MKMMMIETSMALLLSASAWFLAAPAHGFSVNPPSHFGGILSKNKNLPGLPRYRNSSPCFSAVPKETTSSAVLSDLNFWGEQRTYEEVIDYVTWALTLDSSNDISPEKIEVLSMEPPLLLIHDFLSKDMCEEIIESTLETDKLKRSTLGAEQEESKGRTSTNAWLHEDECEYPLRHVAHKVSRLSGMPTSHMENMQVVRYVPGQAFQVHNDHLDSFNDLDGRGRLATCLIYLQEPTSGGETRFVDFNLNVPPEQGSALFFWNTIERPGSEGYNAHMFLHSDERLAHAGLPVEEGEKWVCNSWIHPVDIGTGIRGLDE